MTHLTFTDHYDPQFPPSDCDFSLDIPAVFEGLSRLREEYRGRLDIGIGMEFGFQPGLRLPPEETVNAAPFDFIIGSTHVTRGIDPYVTADLIRDVSEEEAYRIYFEEELENLRKYDCYDIAGHLDYVVRYGPNRNRYYTWERYGGILDAILRILIEKGKGLEINTAGLRAGLGYAHPMPEVLRRYRELGGEILTLGSDAHDPKDLGYGFDTIGEFLTSMGFRYYAVYRSRQPEFYPL